MVGCHCARRHGEDYEDVLTPNTVATNLYRALLTWGLPESSDSEDYNHVFWKLLIDLESLYFLYSFLLKKY